jgi:hypothetical protein
MYVEEGRREGGTGGLGDEIFQKALEYKLNTICKLDLSNIPNRFLFK